MQRLGLPKIVSGTYSEAMVDWETAGRKSDLKLWHALFWIHITLCVLTLVGVALIFYGADSTTSMWVFVPGIALAIMLIVMLPYSYKQWQQAQSSEKP